MVLIHFFEECSKLCCTVGTIEMFFNILATGKSHFLAAFTVRSHIHYSKCESVGVARRNEYPRLLLFLPLTNDAINCQITGRPAAM